MTEYVTGPITYLTSILMLANIWREMCAVLSVEPRVPPLATVRLRFNIQKRDRAVVFHARHRDHISAIGADVCPADFIRGRALVHSFLFMSISCYCSMYEFLEAW